MIFILKEKNQQSRWKVVISLFIGMLFLLLQPSQLQAQAETPLKDTITLSNSLLQKQDTLQFHSFKPDPNIALWRSIICPGLGQIYNRKYWKLPIVYGSLIALTYAFNWNNKYYQDYSVAYKDLMDDNPNTKSYLDFLPIGTTEESFDSNWLKQTFKRKNDYYRRYRDLCVIGMAAVYLGTILDAYVDAQLYDFDISPDLSLRIEPTILSTNQVAPNSIGLKCSFNF